MSYLAIVKAAEVRLRAEREHATTPPVEVVEQSPTLARAYQAYWNTPESESTETFQAAYADIEKLERMAPPVIAWRTLREAATAWHTETGVCPFCGEPGPLHLPAETPEGELRPLIVRPVTVEQYEFALRHD